jgi:hypothetical protein
MRVLLRMVLGIVVLAAALVLLAPAALLDAPLAARTGERARLVDTSGFWWRGEGVLATQDGAARLPLAWRVAFPPLFSGRLAVTLTPGSDPERPSGSVTIGNGTADVRDLRLRIPAAFVSTFVPALKPLALRGQLDVQAPSFTWNRGRASGTLDATWQQAAIVAGVLPVDLGRVAAGIAPANDGLAGTVRNVGGDVAIDGKLSVRGDIVEVSMTLAPTPRASEALRTTLSLLGRADAEGRVQIDWRGDWR